MNLRLHIFKNENIKYYAQEHHIRFAVIDLDKSNKYPENFVCLLPLTPKAIGKTCSKFSSLFGDKSVELAKTLLTEALKTENDSEIKAEIKRRLRLLEPKPPIRIKCRACGKRFETNKKGRFKPTICRDCREKRHSSQA